MRKMKYILPTIFILGYITACTTTSTNPVGSKEEPDVVFNSPSSSHFTKANTLHIINITSEPSGTWVVVENDRLGKTPLKVGIYGTSERKFFQSVDIEIKPTTEMERALSTNLYFVNHIEGRKTFFGSSTGNGDHIPKNLHLELHVGERNKHQKDPITVDVYHF